MYSRIGFMVIGVVMMSGCVGETNSTVLRSQVDALEAQAHQQDQRIEALKRKLSETSDQVSTFDQAYNWVYARSQDAWNAAPTQEARARIQSCWQDLNKTH
jgi:outer membrane murein-binding lipoprotein Lpp